MPDFEPNSIVCKAYGFDPNDFCEKLFKGDGFDPNDFCEKLFKGDSECHSKLEKCCDGSLKICPPTPLHMYLIYSSIGCLLFLGLIGAVVFWKKRKGKKAGIVGPPGTPGTPGTTRTAGTTGTRTKQTETQAAADYYFGES